LKAGLKETSVGAAYACQHSRHKLASRPNCLQLSPPASESGEAKHVILVGGTGIEPLVSAV